MRNTTTVLLLSGGDGGCDWNHRGQKGRWHSGENNTSRRISNNSGECPSQPFLGMQRFIFFYVITFTS